MTLRAAIEVNDRTGPNTFQTRLSEFQNLAFRTTLESDYNNFFG
jgi:hypothetical protein